MPLSVEGVEKTLASQEEDIRAALLGLSRDLRNIRRRTKAQASMPSQAFEASKILCCRGHADQLLFDFFQWKTSAEEARQNRWVREVILWRETAEAAERTLYAAAEATGALRRAAAVVAKYQAERSLYGWVHQQNVTAGLTPATTVVLEELSKHGLAGEGCKTADANRKHRSHLQFLRRWRKRWNIRQGKVPVGEQLGSAELLSKVRA